MGKKARRARFIPARTTYRVSLDKFLSQKQLWRKSIAKDGSCLFRAVAEQVSLRWYLNWTVPFNTGVV